MNDELNNRQMLKEMVEEKKDLEEKLGAVEDTIFNLEECLMLRLPGHELKAEDALIGKH